MTGGREPFSRYRERLEALGFRPSKSRGQNFLVDPNLHRVIADSVAPAPGDLVLEVGPGLGFLTRELLARGPFVVACEVDGRLASIVAEDLEGRPERERLRLVVHDVLGGEGEGLAAPVEAALAEAPQAGAGRFLVVANLPYAISGPFLAAVFRSAHGLPDAMALLVQRELGERLAAAPGSRTYGALPATLGTAFRVQLLRTVPGEAFRPRPRVESAIIRCTAREGAAVRGFGATQRGEFADFVRTLFASRRKKLKAGLMAAEARFRRRFDVAPEVLDQRAEQLDPDTFLALWQGSTR